MLSPEQTIARRAAERLTDLDPGLPEQVNRALLAGRAGGPPTWFFDPSLAVSVAAFVVNIAQFGWRVYCDLKTDNPKTDKAPRDALACRIHDEIEPPPGLPPERYDRIVTVMVEEIANTDDDRNA